MVLGNINIHAQNPDFLFMVEYAIKAPSGHNTQLMWNTCPASTSCR